MNDVKIKVHPTFLKCGDEVIIEAEHLKDQAIPVVLSSESLGIEDSLQTPFIIKKKISVEGKHELRFEYGTDPIKVEEYTGPSSDTESSDYESDTDYNTDTSSDSYDDSYDDSSSNSSSDTGSDSSSDDSSDDSSSDSSSDTGSDSSGTETTE